MAKKVSSKFVSFYITYRDANGFEHHTVNRYNRLSGLVETLKDHLFDGIDPFAYIAKRYQEESKRFQVVSDKNYAFAVVDTQTDSTIASFAGESDASKLCEQLNLDDKYLDDLEEEDPWA